MATHSSILAWRIPWTEEPSRHSPWGRKELDTTDVTRHTRTQVYFIRLGRVLVVTQGTSDLCCTMQDL